MAPRAVSVDAGCMAQRSTGDPALDLLYDGRRGRVDFVDVPDLGFVVVDGTGAPADASFTEAVQALYTVSYGAHFAVKKAAGSAPRVMPLEALWWVEGDDAQRAVEEFAAGVGGLPDPDRGTWRWRALIAQLAPIDAAVVERVVAQARAEKDLPALDALRFEQWTEGPSAQTLHVGPYATEQATIVTLHKAIAERGSTPRGRHHEIYLSDPRRTAPDRIRTILRQPVEPAPPPGPADGR